MANSDKNILITPSVGLSTNPTIKFNGANNTPTTLRVLDDGTVSFEGTAGQLFSISDGLTGSIFSVNDISGIPSIEVLDTGLVKINQYSGSTVFGSSAAIQNSLSVNAKVSISTASATTPGLIIKGVSSQSANLQEWQNSSGTVIAYINSLGFTSVPAGLYVSGGGGQATALLSVAGAPTVSSIIARGVASQTANLQEWQNSSATALSYITKDGTLDLRNTSATAFTNSNSGTVGPKIDLWGGQYGIGIASGRMTFFTSASGGIAIKQDSYNGTSKFDVAYNGRTGLSLDFYQYTYPTVYIGDMAYGFSAEGSYLRYYTSGLSGGGHVWYGSSDNSLLRMILSNNGTLLLRGISAQTADLQQWQNSAGSILTRITSSGNIGIGVSSPLNKIEISHAADMTLLSTGGAISATTSVDANNGTTTGYVSAASSLLSVVTKSGSALTSLDDGYASFAGGIKLTGDGTVNQTISLAATGLLYGGTITTHIGVKVRPLVNYGTGLITNQYGIVINSQKASYVTNSYGIYQAGNDDLNIINGRTSFNSGAAGYVPIIVKAAASQTANLIEWQNSSGTTLGYINAEGSIYSANRLVSPGDFEARGNSFFGSPSFTGAALNVNTRATNWIGLIIRGVASQSANLQEWQNSSGTVLASVGSGGWATFVGGGITMTGGSALIANSNIYSAYGGIVAGGLPDPIPAQLTSLIRNATTIGLVVRGFASQTAKLQEWQNSSGTTLASVNNNGVFETTASIYTPYLQPVNGGGPYLSLTQGNPVTANTSSASVIPFVIKGAASQTADLQQWQNSAGTVLAKIAADGSTTFASPIVGFVGNSGSYSSTAVSGYNIIHLSQGMFFINSQTGGDYNLATNAYYNSGWKYFESAGSTLLNFGNGRFDFNTASSGTAGNAITYTSKMIIANSGTVTINGFGASAQGLIVKGAASQTADLQQWQDSSGNAIGRFDAYGYFTSYGFVLPTSNGSFESAYGGAFMGMKKTTYAVANPGADIARIYLVAGTNAGTLKLVVKAGASGAETTILDNIPQS